MIQQPEHLAKFFRIEMITGFIGLAPKYPVYFLSQILPKSLAVALPVVVGDRQERKAAPTPQCSAL
jgi:hypothetical protein